MTVGLPAIARATFELHRHPELRDLRTAAFVTAINKVARTYLDMGIFP